MKQVVLVTLMLLLTGLAATAAATTEEERARELQKERTRLQKETDPIDRAKIGVKISDILVEDVGEAVREGNFEEMQIQLTAYAQTIESAHKELLDSGRNAVKKPGGFKELEIALRQHVRKFDELSRMLNLQRRVPLEQTKDLATGIRDKLLKALFP